MFDYRLTTDRNGNRRVRITPKGNGRGFSIQTNGNLPSVHSYAMSHKNGKFIPDTEQIRDILWYVKDYGTDRQKAMMPLPRA